MNHIEQFIRMMKHPVKFRMFLLSNLPAAYFSGLRVRSINEQSTEITIPYKWFTKNPFRSTYFACLSMAAEMSTGALAMMQVHKREPAVSMLVTKVESTYFKKATGLTIFTCNDGDALKTTVDNAIATGEGQTLVAKSIGTNDAGDKIAEFLVTWSFKVRTARQK